MVSVQACVTNVQSTNNLQKTVASPAEAHVPNVIRMPARLVWQTQSITPQILAACVTKVMPYKRMKTDVRSVHPIVYLACLKISSMISQNVPFVNHHSC